MWEGDYQGVKATWVRLFDDQGNLRPTAEEAERDRAEAAEAEAARLREELARLKSQK